MNGLLCLLCCRDFEFSLISGAKLEAMEVTQRLQVNVAVATVQLAYGGKLIVETFDLTAQVFKVCVCFSGRLRQSSQHSVYIKTAVAAFQYIISKIFPIFQN